MVARLIKRPLYNDGFRCCYTVILQYIRNIEEMWCFRLAPAQCLPHSYVSSSCLHLRKIFRPRCSLALLWGYRQ